MKGFVTESWRIRYPGNKHMVKETKCVETWGAAMKLRSPYFAEKGNIIVDPWFQRLLWFKTG